MRLALNSLSRLAALGFVGVVSLSLALGEPARAEEPAVTSGIERLSTMSEAEMRELAAASEAQIADSVKKLAKLEDGSSAEEGGDNCVFNNLAAARALSEAMKSVSSELDRALDSGNRDRAAFELRKMVSAKEKSGQLLADGERCALGEGAADGRTRTKIEGGLTDDDGETQPVPPDLLDFGFDPADGSPF